MSQSNLVKRFKAELKRNPQKSAVLAILCLVALWFWAPLVMKWLPGQKPSVAAAPPAAGTGIAPTTGVDAQAANGQVANGQSANGPATEAGKPALPNWDKLSEWLSRDRLTKSAELPILPRDPFTVPEVKAENKQLTAENQQKAEPPEVTPQAAGLVLTSTAVSNTHRVATIGGRVYEEQAVITLGLATGTDEGSHGASPAKGTAAEAGSVAELHPGVQFSLEEIHPHHVVLSRAGKRYELKIQRGGKAIQGNKIVLRGGVRISE